MLFEIVERERPLFLYELALQDVLSWKRVKQSVQQTHKKQHRDSTETIKLNYTLRYNRFHGEKKKLNWFCISLFSLSNSLLCYWLIVCCHFHQDPLILPIFIKSISFSGQSHTTAHFLKLITHSHFKFFSMFFFLLPGKEKAKCMYNKRLSHFLRQTNETVQAFPGTKWKVF